MGVAGQGEDAEARGGVAGRSAISHMPATPRKGIEKREVERLLVAARELGQQDRGRRDEAQSAAFSASTGLHRRSEIVGLEVVVQAMR